MITSILGFSGLKLHSSGTDPINFFGAQSSLWGGTILVWEGTSSDLGDTAPECPPCGAGPAEKEIESAASVKHNKILEILFHNATCEMFQNKKSKRKAAFAITEVAKVALCPPIQNSVALLPILCTVDHLRAISRASERKFSRGYEGRCRAPKISSSTKVKISPISGKGLH